jgi:hypothetical protein
MRIGPAHQFMVRARFATGAVTFTGSDAALTPLGPAATIVYCADSPGLGAGSVKDALVNPRATVLDCGCWVLMRWTR